MKIIQRRIFEGHNIYSHKKCIRIDVDLEGYADIPSNHIPNFNFNLIKIIPELEEHRCGIDEERGFIKRLDEGTYLAHICEHIILALENRMDIDVSYGKSREIKGDLYYIIIQYEYRETALAIIQLAVDLINALIKQLPINIESRIIEIKNILNEEQIGPSTKAICDAAKEYNMPVMEISDSGIYQIGYGKMAKRIEAAIGDDTNCLAVDISCNKLLTKKLLNLQNIPVAEGYKIYNIIDLLRKGEMIGYPVVLKPQFGNKGKHVFLDINNEKQLLEAYNCIRKYEKDIIIESYYKGEDYRVCVVNNKVVAVSHRINPFVIGDGKNSVRMLIEKVNNNPLRGNDHERPLTKIKIDGELLNNLRKNNISLDYCPKENEKVVLRQNANISTGAIALDCTDSICDENIELCVRTAKTIGLDICGIDICTKDISQPLEKDGVIIEVNAAPGIRMHLYPAEGKKRDVGKAIVDMLYKGKPKNIPLVSITGTNGKTTTTRLISYTLKNIGYNVGMTSTDGVYVDGRCIHKGDDSGFKSAKSILMNKDVDVAVLETARGGIIRKGLAYDAADVAVITNITNDHLGLDGIETMEQLSFVKALVAETVKKDGFTIINADDKYSLSIIERIKNEIIYFSKDKDNAYIQKNIKDGKIAVYIENNKIMACNNHKTYRIAECDKIPISYGGILQYNIENAMAACSALVGLNVDYCIISKSFLSFNTNENKGRFNIYNYEGRKVILDYGHNLDGYKRVLDSVVNLKNRNNIIGVIGVPGDRQNSIMHQIGRYCAKKLDKIIIKEDKDRRGRAEGEVAEELYDSVIKANSKFKPIICLDEIDALKTAINISKKNDIIIVFYEKIDPLIDILNSSYDVYNTTNQCESIK